MKIFKKEIHAYSSFKCFWHEIHLVFYKKKNVFSRKFKNCI